MNMLNFYQCYGKLLQYRWLTLVVTLCVVFVIAKGMGLLQFSTNYRVFFSPDNPQLMAFETLQDIYDKSDNVLFVVAPDSGNIFTQQSLSIIHEITQLGWQFPYSTRVDSITNYQHTRANGDELIVEDLVTDPQTLTDSQIKMMRSVALTEPQLVGRLVSKQGHVSAVNITVRLPDDDPTAVFKLAKHTREIAHQIEQKYPVKVYLTGIAMMNNAFAEASQKDMTSLYPIMFIIILVTLFLLLRSIVLVIGILFVVILSVVTSLGIIGWLGWKITPPIASAPVAIMTLCIADCIHLCVTFLQQYQISSNKIAALKESLRVNLQPIFITTLTTAIGFLSMNFSEVPPLRHFGTLVAIGVAAAFVFATVFLPAFIAVIPIKHKSKQFNQYTGLLKIIAEFVLAQHKKIFIIISLCFLFCVYLMTHNQLDDAFVEYFDPSVEFRNATDFTLENLVGIYNIEYNLENHRNGLVTDPDFLQQIERFSKWLRQQDEVMHVQTITDTFKRLNQNLHGDDESWYQLPKQQDLAAQYLLLYEMSLPYGLDLTNQVNMEKSATRLVVTFVNLNTKGMLAVEEKINLWAQQNMPDVLVQGSSSNLMFSHIGYRNTRSSLVGFILALILISAILVVVLKSLRIGAISLVPNLFPVIFALGIWGLTVGKIGMSMSSALGMTLGIVVDDTIHFLSKYFRARKEQSLSISDAIRYAFETVGLALWVTTTVLVLGFGVLAFSAFKQNSDMGFFTSLTLLIALIFDFLFLPALLLKGDKKNM